MTIEIIFWVDNRWKSVYKFQIWSFELGDVYFVWMPSWVVRTDQVIHVLDHAGFYNVITVVFGPFHWLLPTRNGCQQQQKLNNQPRLSYSPNQQPCFCRPPSASSCFAATSQGWTAHNSEASHIRDVLSLYCWDITRKSTWIFKIWLRFVKYRSPLSRDLNFHRNGRVVMKLEQFEVEDPKTLPPLHFRKF